MIEEAIYSRLSGTAALTAIVSTRIYPGYASQGDTIPYVTFMLYNSDVNPAMGDNIDIESANFTFTAVSNNYDECRDIIKNVKDALERWTQSSGIEVLYSQVVRYTPLVYDKDAEAYHRGLDMNFHYRPSTL